MAASDNLNQDQFKVYFASKKDEHEIGDIAPAGFPNPRQDPNKPEPREWYSSAQEAYNHVSSPYRLAAKIPGSNPPPEPIEAVVYEGEPQGKLYTYGKGKLWESHRTTEGVKITGKKKLPLDVTNWDRKLD